MFRSFQRISMKVSMNDVGARDSKVTEQIWNIYINYTN